MNNSLLKMQKKLENSLTEMLNDISYKDDYSIIKETIILVGFLLEEDKITKEILAKIDENIKYLDQKYDDLYILVNLFDPINISYKKIMKQKYVDYLRKHNREKKKGNQHYVI